MARAVHRMPSCPPTPILCRDFVSDRSFRPIILHGVSARSVHICAHSRSRVPEASATNVRVDEEPSNEDDLALDAVVADELHHRRRRRPRVDGDVSRDGASDLGDPRAQRLGSGEEPDDVLVREVVGIAVARMHSGGQTRECLEIVGRSRPEFHGQSVSQRPVAYETTMRSIRGRGGGGHLDSRRVTDRTSQQPSTARTPRSACDRRPREPGEPRRSAHRYEAPPAVTSLRGIGHFCVAAVLPPRPGREDSDPRTDGDDRWLCSCGPMILCRDAGFRCCSGVGDSSPHCTRNRRSGAAGTPTYISPMFR